MPSSDTGKSPPPSQSKISTFHQFDGASIENTKRRKVTRACDQCKSKKKKCTGDWPCMNCVRLGGDPCSYDAKYRRGGPPSPPPSTYIRPTSATPTTKTRVGTSRHKSVEEEALAESEVATPTAGQYHGPTSAHFFLGRAWRPLETPGSRAHTPTQNEEDSGVSIFAYGDRAFGHADAARPSWPPQAVTRELMRIYFEYASPTYRILHRPTAMGWLRHMHEAAQNRTRPALSMATQAIIWQSFATASMFRVDEDGETQDADEQGWRNSELYHAEAERLLSRETGAPSLESVQARFLGVLWLLSTSRMNKAWFAHGTVTQLVLALGLHRTRLQANTALPDASPTDEILRECQRRTLWCAYTLDKYISLILGRPRRLRLEDIDQELPAHVNDEDLTVEGIAPSAGKDCVTTAQIVSTLLAQILARSFRDQYTIKGITDRQQVEFSLHRIEEIITWQTMLPPFLSGAIHPSSLNPLFRRQCRAVRLAHFHAVMFVTRPLLLRNYGQLLPEYDTAYRDQVHRCLSAAKNTIDVVSGTTRPLFRPFWHSQYAIFNALSIIYIYLIQTRTRRIPADILRNKSPDNIDEDALFDLADVSQQHLAKATARNAPAWRYSVILDGLRTEVSRLMKSPPPPPPPSSLQHHPSQTQQTQQQQQSTAEPLSAQQQQQQQTQAERRSRSAFINTVVHSSDGVVARIDNDPGTTNNEDVALHGGGGSSTQMTTTTTGPSFTDIAADMGAHNLWGVGMGDVDFGMDFWPQLDSLPLSYTGYADEEPFN